MHIKDARKTLIIVAKISAFTWLQFPVVSAFRLTLVFLQESESPKQHALYVWRELISSYVNAQHIAFVAHSYGGIVVMHLVCQSLTLTFFLTLLILLFLPTPKKELMFLVRSVCLSVCFSVRRITEKRILTKFLGGVGHGPGTK